MAKKSLFILLLLGITSTLHAQLKKQYGQECQNLISGKLITEVILNTKADSLSFLQWVENNAIDECVNCTDTLGNVIPRNVFYQNSQLVYSYLGIIPIAQIDSAKNKYNSIKFESDIDLTERDLQAFTMSRAIVRAEKVGIITPVLASHSDKELFDKTTLIKFKINGIIFNREKQWININDTILVKDFRTKVIDFRIEGSDTIFNISYAPDMPIYLTGEEYILFLSFPSYQYLCQILNRKRGGDFCTNHYTLTFLSKNYVYHENQSFYEMLKLIYGNLD